jgi:hypothetical protein
MENNLRQTFRDEVCNEDDSWLSILFKDSDSNYIQWLEKRIISASMLIKINTLNDARDLLVEARGYIDRMGQDVVRERIDSFLDKTDSRIENQNEEIDINIKFPEARRL